MQSPLFADSPEIVTGVPNWLLVAGVVITSVVAPFFKDVWLLIRRQLQSERERDADEARKDAELALKGRAAASRDESRQVAKLFERIEENESRCREEVQELRDEVNALYRHIMVRETMVGRWMAKVAGWIEYAGTLFTLHKIEYRPFTEPPPDMPPLPGRDDHEEGAAK